MEDRISALKAKKGNKKIAAVTAYSFNTAQIIDKLGFDFILVGDSLGMVVLGYENTRQVTMFDMIHHTKAVARGVKNTLIVGDMPYKSYEIKEDAIDNASAFIAAGANAVKIEGNKPEIISALAEENIPVMGHIGLTPQTAESFKVQGKDKESAERLLKEAKEIEKSGAFALVLECIPEELGKKITESINIPAIGIGAGRYADGQILVINDLIGLFDRFTPKFLKKYADTHKVIKDALTKYKEEVLTGEFPGEENVYK